MRKQSNFYICKWDYFWEREREIEKEKGILFIYVMWKCALFPIIFSEK